MTCPGEIRQISASSRSVAIMSDPLWRLPPDLRSFRAGLSLRPPRLPRPYPDRHRRDAFRHALLSVVAINIIDVRDASGSNARPLQAPIVGRGSGFAGTALRGVAVAFCQRPDQNSPLDRHPPIGWASKFFRLRWSSREPNPFGRCFAREVPKKRLDFLRIWILACLPSFQFPSWSRSFV